MFWSNKKSKKESQAAQQARGAEIENKVFRLLRLSEIASGVMMRSDNEVVLQEATQQYDQLNEMLLDLFTEMILGTTEDGVFKAATHVFEWYIDSPVEAHELLPKMLNSITEKIDPSEVNIPQYTANLAMTWGNNFGRMWNNEDWDMPPELIRAMIRYRIIFPIF